MPQTDNDPLGSGQRTSTLERRLRAEWQILCALAERNPGRLIDLTMIDLTISVTLRHTPALVYTDAVPGEDRIQTEHRLRLEFPRFFPAAPMELYLRDPMQHPNIHPETGFVCLWERHRVSHTAEHAILKTGEILGWRLSNQAAVHVMQPAALARLLNAGKMVAATLAAPPLFGLAPQTVTMPAATSNGRRRRLS